MGGGRVTRLAVAVLLGSVLVAACGSDGGGGADAGERTGPASTSTSTSAPPPDGSGPEAPEPDRPVGEVDACAIASTLDLDELLAGPPAASSGARPPGPVCVVEAADPASQATVKLVIETESGAADFAEQRQVLGADVSTTGLGDEAFHAGNHLFVLDGNTLVYLQVERRSIDVDAVDDELLEAAMATVLEALGI